MYLTNSMEKYRQPPLLPFRKRQFILLVVSFLLISMLVVPPRVVAQEVFGPGSDLRNFQSHDPLMTAFEGVHTKVVLQAKQGRVAAKIKDRADKLSIQLKKYMINKEAKIKILSLDVMNGPAEKRKTALQKIIRLSAASERTKTRYLLALEMLLGDSNNVSGSNLAEVLDGNEGRVSVAHEIRDHTIWKTKTLDIEFEIAPEDVSQGDYD